MPLCLAPQIHIPLAWVKNLWSSSVSSELKQNLPPSRKPSSKEVPKVVHKTLPYRALYQPKQNNNTQAPNPRVMVQKTLFLTSQCNTSQLEKWDFCSI